MFRGRYINLDRSTDRCEALQTQLRSLGLDEVYERFPGVEGRALAQTNSPLKPGELGCFESHRRLIEAEIHYEKHLHIIEDDVVFSQEAKKSIDSIIANKLLDTFDIILLECYIPFHLAYIRDYLARWRELGWGNGKQKGTFQIINLQGRVFASATSYLIANKAKQTVLDELNRECELGPRQAVDLVFRDLINSGKLKGGLMFPFLTSLDQAANISGTTIDGRYDAESSLAASVILRQLFFCDRNLVQILPALGYLLANQPALLEDMLLTGVLRFATSPDYQAF